MIRQPYFIGLIVLLLLIKFLVSAYLPLGNDEVYYLTYARYPSYHYYDHPLMVGWLLKLLSFNLILENTLVYRLFALLLSMFTTFFVYQSVLHVSNLRAAQLAVILFISSLYNSVIAGLFIMPDAPMLFFWTLSIYLAVLTFFDKNKLTLVNEKYFIPLCISLGLTLLSKFHGIFLFFGIMGFVFFYRRKFMLTWTFWEGIVVYCLFTIPVILWNSNNDWVQFSFYAKRTSNDFNINISGFVKELVGQILYNNPVVFFFIIYFGFFKYHAIQSVNKKAFLLWASLPFILFILPFSLFKETLPHWSGPSYVALIMLSSVVAEQTTAKWSLFVWLRTSVSILFITCIAGTLVINMFPGTLGSKKNQLTYGSGDFTLDMYGWENSSHLILFSLTKKGYNKLPIVADNWFPGAHIDEYIARPNQIPFFVLGNVEKTHHYQWVNTKRGNWQQIDSAITIVPSNYYKNPQRSFESYFKKAELIDQIAQYRNGEQVRNLHIYLLTK